MSRTDAPFVHLHVHSHYSLLEALPQIDALVEIAKADGQTALALTDNGNLYGAIDFYKACKKAEINPILGVDMFVAPRTRHDKDHALDSHTFRIVLLVKNEVGYHNLLRLISRAWTEGLYNGRPRADRALLEEYREGLIAIVPSFAGEHAKAIKNDDTERARESLAWYKKTYGTDCYVEITHHPEIEGHEVRMQKIIALAREIDIPLVAAHDVYYLKPEDAVARELVVKIREGSTLNQDNAENLPDFSFISTKTANEYFKHLPEALENTTKIAKSCALELTLGKAIFPTFKIPADTTDDAELSKLVEAGIPDRHMQESPVLRTRINYELGIIAQKKYASYFLIVADLLAYARSVGILTNTRGSAAGSLVSYLCGITTVDPIAFNMPFERFLNPERPSAPDIDMDIADNRRDELIEYARQKYGDAYVVQIGTFGTMLARAAVRDVSRALGHSYGVGDRIAKLIPFPKQGFPVFIKQSIEEVPELKEAYAKDAEAHEILDLAQKVEGNARHIGVHAAGVIIAPTHITDFSPIQPDPKGGKTITQYDMYSITDEYGGVGLLKFDFLGLTNLSVLADAVERVRVRLKIQVDLNTIPLDDKDVFAMLTRGETLGVFQMAGGGMTAALKELKPTVVHDLNAMVALYRPGPIAFIPEYIRRKHNPALVTYLDPRLESILKPTHGVLIYQDDVMMIAVQLAGYSWGEADKFRKAMGKKIPEEMAKQKDKFVSGCIERGMKPAVTQELWQQIETFAAYGFNKSHAVSYGGLAYKTAFMKAHYPLDYMAAVLTATGGDIDEISEIVAECKRMGIQILPPSVNESLGNFTVTNEKSIRFGLYSIKNFGTAIADLIIKVRGKQGFKDLADFLTHVNDDTAQGKNLNKKSLESLVMSGALDDFGDRGNFYGNIELLLSFHREQTKAPTDQISLFGSLSTEKATLTLPKSNPVSIDTRLNWEKELLGLYISGHPLDKYRELFAKQKMSLKVAKTDFPRGAETVIAGMLESIQPIVTKGGERMLFGIVNDLSDTIEIVAFPRTLKEYSELFKPGTCLALKGKFSERNGTPSFIVDKIKAL